MRFRHRLYDMRYVIVAADSGRDAWGHVSKIPGIAAEFDNYFCDTKTLQRKYRWDDETREMVEKYLLTHEDFNKRGGRGFFLDIGERIPDYYIEELGDALRLDPFAGAIGTLSPDAKLACMVTVITPGGPAELCGREVMDGSRFCSIHANLDDDPGERKVAQDMESEADEADEFDEVMALSQTEPVAVRSVEVQDPRDAQIAELNQKIELILGQLAAQGKAGPIETEVPRVRVPKKGAARGRT
jgi:hypothetical protein